MKRKKEISWAELQKMLVFVVLCGIFIFFAFFYKYHLFHIEQNQLFLLTWEYFVSYFNKPAAIACYLGDFFTQFYFLKGGGAIVITLSLALLWWLLNKVIYRFRHSKWIFFISLLVVVFVALLHSNLVYSLASTISFIFTGLALFGYTWILNSKLRLLLGILLTPLLYILFGAYLIFFVLGSIVFELKHSRNSNIVILVYSTLVISTYIFFPLSLRQYYYLTVKQAYIFPNPDKMTIFPDFKSEKILALDCEWYFNRPDKILLLSKKSDLKNIYISYFINLALSLNKQLPYELLNNYQPAAKSLFLPLNKDQSYTTISFSNEVYYLLGDVNEAQHCALLATTFSPKGQSSRMFRRLVEINIINGEYEAAEKCIKMLEKTWFHSEWAKEMRDYLYNEELCNKTQWIVEKRKQIPIQDYIKGNPNNFELTLKNLLKDHPENTIAMDYLLCYYLLNKDLDSFYKTIIVPEKNNQIGVLPPLYQEALLIYFTQHLEDKNKDLIPFSREIFNNFVSYTDIYASNKGSGNALIEKYGKTYWFYYHYAVFKKNNVK